MTSKIQWDAPFFLFYFWNTFCCCSLLFCCCSFCLAPPERWVLVPRRWLEHFVTRVFQPLGTSPPGGLQAQTRRGRLLKADAPGRWQRANSRCHIHPDQTCSTSRFISQHQFFWAFLWISHILNVLRILSKMHVLQKKKVPLLGDMKKYEKIVVKDSLNSSKASSFKLQAEESYKMGGINK